MYYNWALLWPKSKIHDPRRMTRCSLSAQTLPHHVRGIKVKIYKCHAGEDPSIPYFS